MWLLLLMLHKLEAELPQCFHFTWLGGYENKSNIMKETCEQRVGDFNGIPCEMPLVVTANDTVPDVRTLWQNESLNREHYLCQMSAGFSCVKYSYIFKGGIQNITYMCAKVNASSGCYRQTHANGMKLEACVCNSRLGLMPCNGGWTLHPTELLLYSLALLCTLLIAK
ncbi:CG34236 [Drosophila busckii]|uniref:CG34236 n=1 Tax=Drosophila busckii TaxID=30019 RepID=A0A0M4E8G4_DROBS|nr:CG34236 [Drosophila busckii]